MKRRAFLKSVLGVLALPCLPQVKVAKKVEFRKYAKLEAPTMPLVDGIEPLRRKMTYVTRILNDDFVHILETTA